MASIHRLCQMISILMLLIFSSTYATPPNHHQHRDHSKERIEDAFKSHVKQNNDIDDHELDHEAILGSRQTAHEYDKLSPEESKRRLRLLVENGMDFNRDGFVDKQELSDWVLKSFKNLAVEEGEDRLEEDDINGDGFVTWDEYLKGEYNADMLKDGNNELLEEDEILWKAADLNDDGKLDATEYAAFHSPEEFGHMHSVLVNQMLARRDLNHDGHIDFDEYIKDQSGEKIDTRSEHYIAEKDKFDKEYDLNRDGKLDYNESLDWIVPNNTEIAQNEATHLITSADSNHDGKLSVEEIVANHDVFVGSEATDFGEIGRAVV